MILQDIADLAIKTDHFIGCMLILYITLAL